LHLSRVCVEGVDNLRGHDKRGGFGSEDAGAEGDECDSGVASLVDFVVGKSAFGADQNENARGMGLMKGCRQRQTLLTLVGKQGEVIWGQTAREYRSASKFPAPRAA